MEDSKGMIDISAKNVTVRLARAGGTVVLGPEAFETLTGGTCIKGDVLATAKVAAIQAAKSAPAIIPMCHPILIEGVDVGFALNDDDKSVSVHVSVRSTGKTGVEMEALTGASAACLTIYDMLKYKSRSMIITDVKLLEKTGGKSGDYKRDD
jgi:cyclic pyranopterin phosphate synthase